MKSVQDLVDEYYHKAYERTWASTASEEEKLERTIQAWERSARRILKETGYNLA